MPLSSLRGKIIAYDTETTGLNPWGDFSHYGYYPARPFAFAFCDAYGNQAYIRWEVDPKTRQVIPEKKSLKAMSVLLSDPHVVKIGHNLCFDIRMSRKSGIKFNWKHIHDTQFLAHVFTGGNLQTYALKPLSKMWLDIDDEDQKDLMDSVKAARRLAKKRDWQIATKETHGKEPVKSDYWLGDKNLCKKYALQDAERTMLLYLGLSKELKKDTKLLNVYKREIALSKVIYRMEERGVRVLPNRLKNLRKFYSEYSDKWLKVAEENGGKGLNFNSPKQMVQKFCVDRKCHVRRRTKTGNPSIDNTELQRLAQKDKLAKAILEYKAGQGMITKFINSYEKFMVKEKGVWVLHPNFRQTGTKTGRLSCSDPNLQQAAAEDSAKKKADIGLKPREALGPRKGYIWLLFDFSQMEVWVFSFDANDKTMKKALLKGKDFHLTTAKKIWGNKPDWKEAKKLYRKKGKTMMFLKIYGGGPKAVAEQLGCSTYEARKVVEEFDNRLPGVKDFIDRMMQQAERNGSIENRFGRKYFFPDPNFSYKSVNYRIQGTCADVMKRAMIRLDKVLRKSWKDCHMLLTLHDELIIEVPINKNCPKLQKTIINMMQKDSKRVGIPIPLPITLKTTTDRWSNAKKVE